MVKSRMRLHRSMEFIQFGSCSPTECRKMESQRPRRATRRKLNQMKNACLHRAILQRPSCPMMTRTTRSRWNRQCLRRPLSSTSPLQPRRSHKGQNNVPPMPGNVDPCQLDSVLLWASLEFHMQFQAHLAQLGRLAIECLVVSVFCAQLFSRRGTYYQFLQTGKVLARLPVRKRPDFATPGTNLVPLRR